MDGAVGSASVEAARPPAMMMRIRLAGSSWVVITLPASFGNRCSTPSLLRLWQAEQVSTKTASPTCMRESDAASGAGAGDPAAPRSFRYTAIALRSASAILEVEFSITSFIGPLARLERVCPVFRYCTMSATDHLPRPACMSLVMLGAVQLSIWLPRRYLSLTLAPNELNGVWQAPQWPRPSAR